METIIIYVKKLAGKLYFKSQFNDKVKILIQETSTFQETFCITAVS